METFWDISDLSLWERAFPALRGETLRGRLTREGSPAFRFDDYVSGAYGQRMLEHLLPWMNYGEDLMAPGLLAYWRERGIRKEAHPDPADPAADWYAYLPADAAPGEALPVWFIDHGRGRELLDAEAWGFVQLVSEKRIIVLLAEDGDDDRVVLGTLDRTAELYPVDWSRVYMVGHSFSGSCGSRIAVTHPERFAGLCMLGAQFNPVDVAPTALERAAAYKLPRIDVAGTAERLLPYNTSLPGRASPRISPRCTPTAMDLRSGFAEQSFWRRMNGCGELTLEAMTALRQSWRSPSERAIGLPLDRWEVRDLGGRAHYIGDVADSSGLVWQRIVGVEGAPHYPSAYGAELAWEFLHGFSRDSEGQVLRDSGDRTVWQKIE